MKHDMTSHHQYSILFAICTLVVALLVASPALSRLLVFPRNEFFTELWILDSNHATQNYPFNITLNRDYNVFLGIANHLGYSAYCLVEVKLRNQTQSAPNSFSHTSSTLPPLFNITAIVADEGIREQPLTFSFGYQHNELLSQVELNSLMLNHVGLDLMNNTIAWNPGKSEFRCDLFFELWIYDTTTNSFKYHERYVSLRLNMTV